MSEKSIYRFMNFFELYSLLVHRELKFSKLRLMQDKNEGLGEVIRMQSTEFGFPLRNSRERINEYHSEVLERTYLSCWTSTPDAMAMWLLYSPDFSAIRVRTTSKKLHDALQRCASFDYVPARAAEIGSLVPRLPTVGEVKYADFRSLHQASKESLVVYYRLVKEFVTAQPTTGEFPRVNAIPEELALGCFLKDSAFEHESEVRATFLGHVRNSMSAAEFDNLPNSMGKDMGYPLLDTTTKDNSPPVYNVSIENGFIEEICFDPRMPKYRKDEILRMLGTLDVPVVSSNAFGYILADNDLTIPEHA